MLIQPKQIDKLIAGRIYAQGHTFVSGAGVSTTDVTSVMTAACTGAGHLGSNLPVQAYIADTQPGVDIGPNNVVEVFEATSRTKLASDAGNEVYGRITEAAGVWTVQLFELDSAGVETPFEPTADRTLDFGIQYYYEFKDLPADFATSLKAAYVNDDPKSSSVDKVIGGRVGLTNISFVSGVGVSTVDVSASLTAACLVAGEGAIAVPLQTYIAGTQVGVEVGVNNRVEVYNGVSKRKLSTPSGNEVYGRITEAAGVWTVTLYEMDLAGVELVYEPAADIILDMLVPYYFDFASLPANFAEVIKNDYVQDDPIVSGSMDCIILTGDYLLGPKITFTQTNGGGEIDVIDTGLSLTREPSSNVMHYPYNPQLETEYDMTNWDSPKGTKWNMGGWYNLQDYQSRTYYNFGDIVDFEPEYGECTQLIMHDTANNKYYLFTNELIGERNVDDTWVYYRREIIDATTCRGITFADGTKMTSASKAHYLFFDARDQRKQISEPGEYLIHSDWSGAGVELLDPADCAAAIGQRITIWLSETASWRVPRVYGNIKGYMGPYNESQFPRTTYATGIVLNQVHERLDFIWDGMGWLAKQTVTRPVMGKTRRYQLYSTQTLPASSWQELRSMSDANDFWHNNYNFSNGPGQLFRQFNLQTHPYYLVGGANLTGYPFYVPDTISNLPSDLPMTYAITMGVYFVGGTAGVRQLVLNLEENNLCVGSAWQYVDANQNVMLGLSATVTIVPGNKLWVLVRSEGSGTTIPGTGLITWQPGYVMPSTPYTFMNVQCIGQGQSGTYF